MTLDPRGDVGQAGPGLFSVGWFKPPAAPSSGDVVIGRGKARIIELREGTPKVVELRKAA